MPKTNVICEPEFEIAKACAKNTGRAIIALDALLELCDTLSDIYKREKANRDRVLEFQKQALVDSVLFKNGASFAVWVVVARMLLRGVTMGVGVATVMGALPRAAATLYALQHDLKAVAHSSADNIVVIAAAATIRCGTPFAPMTCDAMRSPYLLKWIFSREDMLQRPLTPNDGRLLVAEDGRWFVPLSSRPPMNRRLIDLEKENQTKTRQKHFDMLRLFKRSRLIDASNAKGNVIHYTISIEEDDGDVLMLIRDTSDAINDGIELVTEEGESLLPAQQQAKKKISLESLIHHAPDTSSRIDKYTLRVAVATSRAVPRRPRRIAPVPLLLPPPPPPPPAPRRGRPPPPPQSTIVLRSRKQNEDNHINNNNNNGPKKQNKKNGEDIKGIIVQTKYDGDRMQGHVEADGKVTLFTRRGVDVTTLYSNIAEALKKSTQHNAPCIVDGELIVIDSAFPARPIPWTNEKWRHNHREPTHGAADSMTIDEFFAQPENIADKDVVMMLEYNDTALTRPWDATDTEDISFATQSGLRYFDLALDMISIIIIIIVIICISSSSSNNM